MQQSCKLFKSDFNLENRGQCHFQGYGHRDALTIVLEMVELLVSALDKIFFTLYARGEAQGRWIKAEVLEGSE
jgi:hypothetical protein